MDVEKLVFIDETWTPTTMTRRRERAPKCQRCIGSAPMVTDGPMDGEIFLAYVRQFLSPTLAQTSFPLADM